MIMLNLQKQQLRHQTRMATSTFQSLDEIEVIPFDSCFDFPIGQRDGSNWNMPQTRMESRTNVVKLNLRKGILDYAYDCGQRSSPFLPR